MMFSCVAVSLGSLTSSSSMSWGGGSSYVSRMGATGASRQSCGVVLSRRFTCVIWRLIELCMSSDSTISASKSFSSVT